MSILEILTHEAPLFEKHEKPRPCICIDWDWWLSFSTSSTFSSKQTKTKTTRKQKQQQQKVEALGSVTVKIKQNISLLPQRQRSNRMCLRWSPLMQNRIWREIAIFSSHSEPPSDQFRKQSWLERNWFGLGEQSRQACTRPSRAAQAVQDHLTLYCIKNNVIWHVLVFQQHLQAK